MAATARTIVIPGMVVGFGGILAGLFSLFVLGFTLAAVLPLAFFAVAALGLHMVSWPLCLAVAVWPRRGFILAVTILAAAIIIVDLLGVVLAIATLLATAGTSGAAWASFFVAASFLVLAAATFFPLLGITFTVLKDTLASRRD